MIVLGIYLHHNTVKNVSQFEEDSFVIENLIDDTVEYGDWSLLNEAILNIDTSEMKDEEWYRLTFKRNYEDDGSGFKRILWFELVDSQQINEKREMTMGKDQCKECGGELMNFSCQCALVNRTEKQMTDEELADFLCEVMDTAKNNLEPRTPKIGTWVAKYQSDYLLMKNSLGFMGADKYAKVNLFKSFIAESRKGMFTEEDIRLCAWDAIEDTNHDKFDSWFKQWLTERKGR